MVECVVNFLEVDVGQVSFRNKMRKHALVHTLSLLLNKKDTFSADENVSPTTVVVLMVKYIYP